jgi:chromosome segregation ATPase
MGAVIALASTSHTTSTLNARMQLRTLRQEIGDAIERAGAWGSDAVSYERRTLLAEVDRLEETLIDVFMALADAREEVDDVDERRREEVSDLDQQLDDVKCELQDEQGELEQCRRALRKAEDKIAELEDRLADAKKGQS